MTNLHNRTNRGPRRRPKIPQSIAEEVMFRSQMRCCVCGERGDQIHHIDLDPTNNKFENLVFLCYKDHNEASIKGALQRKLTPELLRKFRDDWYDKVKSERRPRDVMITGDSSGSTEDRFQLTMDAMIVLDVRKAFSPGFHQDWKGAKEVLSSMYVYAYLAGTPARLAILEGLHSVSDHARYDMPSDLARQISDLAFDFLPIPSLHQRHDSVVSEFQLRLFKVGVEIADDLIYDGAVKLLDLRIVFEGTKLLWQIHQFACLNDIRPLMEIVEKKYEWLFSTLNRPGLQNAVRLLRLFHDYVTTGNPELPLIPDDLEYEIYNPKRRARHGS